MALVREDGRSLYMISDWPSHGVPIDPWVAKNVTPLLLLVPNDVNIVKCAVQTFGLLIEEFMRGDRAPLIITDWPADVRYFCDVIEKPMGEMIAIPSFALQVHRVDAYPTILPGAVQHNAWWDAMALRLKLSGA